MRYSLTIIFSFLITFSSTGQDLKKILKQNLISFLNYPSDSIYVSDRKQLERVENYKCLDSIATFNYTSKTGDNIQIEIIKGRFDEAKHSMEFGYKKTKEEEIGHTYVKNIVDYKYAFGIDKHTPKTEIKSLKIKWNDKNLEIPDSVFSNFFEPKLCHRSLPIESYLTNNQYLFIYINGSEGAGSYSVKFIFNNEKYITRIVDLNETENGFDFIDGIEKDNNK